MSDNVHELAKKFESFRKKNSGKKFTYPIHLRKKAASLAQRGEKSSSLASIFGVSDASIKVWEKKFPSKSEQQIAADDFIPVQSVTDSQAGADVDENKELKMRVLSIELKGPKTLVMKSLYEVLHRLSGGMA